MFAVLPVLERRTDEKLVLLKMIGLDPALVRAKPALSKLFRVIVSGAPVSFSILPLAPVHVAAVALGLMVMPAPAPVRCRVKLPAPAASNVPPVICNWLTLKLLDPDGTRNRPGPCTVSV